MKIREKKYTIDYLLLYAITFEKWQILAENCFDTDYIDYINAVMNAKVIFNNEYKIIEKMEYQKTMEKLNMHKINIINQIIINKEKIKRKIHK